MTTTRTWYQYCGGPQLYHVREYANSFTYELVLTAAQRAAAREWALAKQKELLNEHKGLFNEQKELLNEQKGVVVHEKQKHVPIQKEEKTKAKLHEGTAHDKLANRSHWTSQSILEFVTAMSRCLHKRESTLPNAGFGLFTSVNIPSGFIFAEYYSDTKMTDAALQHQYQSYTAPYAISLKNPDGTRSHIDAADPQHSSMARYANDARAAEKNNTEFEQHNDRIFLKATRTIAAKEEIFVSYGRYWGKPEAEIEQRLVESMVEEHVIRHANVANAIADKNGVKTWTKEEILTLVSKSTTLLETALQRAIKHQSLLVLALDGGYQLNMKNRAILTLRSVCQMNNPKFLSLTNKRRAHFRLSCSSA